MRSTSKFALVCRRWIALLALVASGCGDEDTRQAELVESIEPIEPVVLPSDPPLCEKSPAQLIVFAAYTSPNCSTDDGVRDECLPACGAGNPACPAGSECVGPENLRHCARANCEQDASICTGGTMCNPGTHHCELISCSDDSTCPCGSYCDLATQRCRLDCLTGLNSVNLGLGCNGTL